tara:strand:- start:562 stop:1077 length:516 start_codon:yes stop_codon:yes gene_type:complete
MLTSNILCAAVIALGIGGGNTPNTNSACRYMDHIIEESGKNNIDTSVMLALIHHESRFKPKARSRANACGLTQILPRYTGSNKTGVPRLTCEQLFDPTTSITMGARTLSFWYRTYARNKNLKVALCGYNAGYRCKGANPHPSGMRYARSVMRTSRKIKSKAKFLAKSVDEK